MESALTCFMDSRNKSNSWKFYALRHLTDSLSNSFVVMALCTSNMQRGIARGAETRTAHAL